MPLRGPVSARSRVGSGNVTTGATIRPATGSDAVFAAVLGERRREQYAAFSPVFWRPAPDGRRHHELYLSDCLEGDRFSGFTAVADTGEPLGFALADTAGVPPPFRDDEATAWFVDDLTVTDDALWPTVGRQLTETAVAAARAAGARGVITVGAARDLARRAALESIGFGVAAHWWVKEVDASFAHPSTPLPAAVETIVGPAPPVYAPGGEVALALAPPGPDEIAPFTAWAAGRRAVLAIVPAFAGDSALRDALAAQGYEPASEWYSIDLS